MKKIILEAGAEIIKVFWIYVFLMAMAGAICIGIAQPVLGVGGLAVAVLVNNMCGIKIHIGGSYDGSD